MILIDNRNILRIKHRTLLNELVEIESRTSENNIMVEHSRKGPLTLKINCNGKSQYLHSKYDPESEAERFIEELRDIEKYDHILFLGIGLGYHIKQIMNKYPSMKFSLYEPNKEILFHYLSNYNLKELPVSNLHKIFSFTQNKSLRYEIQLLIQELGNNVFIAPLPVYEKIYQKEITIVMEILREILKEKKSSLITDVSFQKRWTINSIKNFPYVIKTPNILLDVDKSAFQGKPAIIVAAGPSLTDEFENLKYIKENGLAYIFSVGSAINALIEHDIYPDAACTYDPSILNQKVILKIKDKGILDIPLIFGSSVGYETLQDYPAPMLHMITSQDTIAPFFISSLKKNDIVLDASSIAVVTFQLLKLLGCNQIILVGQNLGYKKNQRYAAGIKYDHVENKLSDKEIEKSIITKDVHGNNIQTTDVYNKMRKQLEMYIQSSTEIEVINTTRGGAHIEGSIFKPLSEVILEKLNVKVVEINWYSVTNTYDKEFIHKQRWKMDTYQLECERIIKNLINELKEINKFIDKYLFDHLEQQFVRFDKEFNKLKENTFYKSFIGPMLRVQNQRLKEETKNIRFRKNLKLKGEEVVKSYGSFLAECQAHLQFVVPFYKELQEQLDEFTIVKNR